MFFERLLSPPFFFRSTATCLPWLGGLALLFLVIGSLWGLIFSPPDYQQGEAFRIIYIHVPAAFLSLALYAVMTIFAVVFLVWRIKLTGLMLPVFASLGATMAFLALITGSLWGKPMWGGWWVWDARLTSELILLLLYLAILSIHQAFPETEKADKIIAILVLVGSIDLPIIHYSVYWWNTLHQGGTILVLAKPKIAATMLYPLLFNLLGFAFFSAWIVLHRTRQALLWRERRQQWVAAVIEKHSVREVRENSHE